MIAYLDASVIMPALVRDDHTPRVFAWLETRPELRFSWWSLVETTSALSHAVRTRRLIAEQRLQAETQLDRFLPSSRLTATIGTDDFETARGFLVRHHILRAPDALHLAVASRHGWMLATLDQRLAEAARIEGVGLALE